MKSNKLPHMIQPLIKYLYLRDTPFTNEEWAIVESDENYNEVYSLTEKYNVEPYELDEGSPRVLTVARLVNTLEDGTKVLRLAKAMNACSCDSPQDGSELPSDQFSKRLAQQISGGRLLRARGKTSEFIPLGAEKPIEATIQHLLTSSNPHVRRIAFRSMIRSKFLRPVAKVQIEETVNA
ncbi:hypothetical protein LRR18_16580, partial [Mangrovimonas sp. AS39]|uniref:hypothetical protein n=1 Tax=Mangrovimonas futianensis TaxID=2895523 RepID=UPI001E529D39